MNTAATKTAIAGTKPTHGPLGFSVICGKNNGSKTCVLTISLYTMADILGVLVLLASSKSTA